MKKIIGVLFLIVSVYCFGIGIYESWRLNTNELDNGLGELAIWLASIFSFVFGIIFLVISIFLLRKRKNF